jgi:hypothetical protein
VEKQLKIATYEERQNLLDNGYTQSKPSLLDKTGRPHPVGVLSLVQPKGKAEVNDADALLKWWKARGLPTTEAPDPVALSSFLSGLHGDDVLVANDDGEEIPGVMWHVKASYLSPNHIDEKAIIRAYQEGLLDFRKTLALKGDTQ